MTFWKVLILLISGHLLPVVCDSCAAKSFGSSSVVCTCNASYCDTFPPAGDVTPGNFAMYTSTLAGERFNYTVLPLKRSAANNGQVVINPNLRYQSITGFGGAITDAAGINIFSLSYPTRQKLLESYYSPKGIEYTLGRVPIGSCDFSTHAYSYADTPDDLDLKHFSLTAEDLTIKIPIIKMAQNMSSKVINIFSSPWTAPAWMKTNNAFTGRGFLKGSPGGPYYKAWANYLVKFLDAYKQQGVDMWGMTAQNEPMDGRIPFFSFQSMGFTAEMQRDFIASDLGPALAAAGYGSLKLMILDDDLLLLPGWAKTIYGNESASKYVSGLGVHWYLNGVLSQSTLTDVHNVDPSKFILATEACAGSSPFSKEKVILGSWERAEQYADDIIKDLQNWVTGWTDWNIALNMTGGPNWVNNDVDSPIIVNAANDEFYKQPMYYALGHFSKFLVPGSIRLDMNVLNSEIEGVAFLTPDATYAMVLLNRNSVDTVVDVADQTHSFTVAVKGRSINTIIWKQ